MQEESEEYCGLDCGELLERQAEILNLCVEHARYDPEFAPVMIDKLITQAIAVKQALIGINTNSTDS